MRPLLQSMVDRHQALCVKCKAGPTLLCSGLRPYVDDQYGMPVIHYEECERVRETSGMEVRLRGAFLPPHMIEVLLANRGYPKVVVKDSHVMVGRSKWNRLSWYDGSGDAAILIKFARLMAGLLESDGSASLIVPYHLASARTEVFSTALDAIQYSDLVVVAHLERVVPKSERFVDVIDQLFARIVKGAPTWVIPGEATDFIEATRNKHHPLHGIVSHVVENFTGVSNALLDRI